MAARHSVGYLLTHFDLAASAIPLSLYKSLLLETIGWNETLIRLPSITAGLFSLVVLPFFVRKLFGTRITYFFAWFLVISPFLICYSHLERDYSFFVLLATIAMLSSSLWLITGLRKYLFITVATCVMATCFHLLALISSLTPLCTALFIKCLCYVVRRTPDKINIIPSIKEIIVAILWCLLGISLLLLPALITTLKWLFDTHMSYDYPKIDSLIGLLSLIAGTGSSWQVMIFWVACLLGLILLLRQNRTLGILLLSVYITNLLAIVVTRPLGIHVPRVIARYCIVLFPLSFILASIGLNSLGNGFRKMLPIAFQRYKEFLTYLAGYGFIVASFLAGPLLWIYQTPNNFMNHAAYQESYKPIQWDKPYERMLLKNYMRISFSQASEFYHRLIKDEDAKTIIEYPFPCGYHFNIYYYYQHFHRKNVLAGYLLLPRPFEKLNPSFYSRGPIEWVSGDTTIDLVLSHVEFPHQLKFDNMIHMLDIHAIQSSGASYVVLHKNLFSEERGDQKEGNSFMEISYLTKLYLKHFHEPFFYDPWVIVFKIH